MIPQTSLMPTVIEIAKFVHLNWPNIWWFPGWYLGVPLRYVTGPVVPLILLSLKNIFPVASYEALYLVIIGLVWLMGAWGLKRLIKEFGGGKLVQNWAAGIFLTLPVHILLLSIGTGLGHLTLCLLPWLLLWWQKCLRRWTLLKVALMAFGISFVLLITTTSLLQITVGMLVITLMRSIPERLASLVKTSLVLLTGLVLATVWYTPNYWLAILHNPSFGGQPLTQVIIYLGQLAQAIVPIVLGVWVVQKKYSLSDKLIQFIALFGSSFGFLTLVRFMSNPRFWMDWVGYGLELQFALAIMVPLALNKLINSNKKRYIVILITILTLTIFSAGFITKTWLSENRDYQKELVNDFSKLAKSDERVFVTGSPVFWLGSELTGQNRKFFAQVRGGRDEISIHPTWAMGAYQIREGEAKDNSISWLKILGVSKILVQTEQSQEFFKDYKHLERFSQLQAVNDSQSNILYDFDGHIARTAAPTLLQVESPDSGADTQVLDAYVESLESALQATWESSQRLRIYGDFDQGKLISLAVTYSPDWKLVEGRGELLSDAFGNLVIRPQAANEWMLEYQPKWGSMVFTILSLVVLVICIVKVNSLIRLIGKKAPSLTSTQMDEDVDY